MAVEMAVTNSSGILNNTIGEIFPFLLDRFAPLVRILQIAGIVFILWLLFSISQLFLKFRDSKRLKRIEDKLDALLQKSKKRN